MFSHVLLFCLLLLCVSVFPVIWEYILFGFPLMISLTLRGISLLLAVRAFLLVILSTSLGYIYFSPSAGNPFVLYGDSDLKHP